MAKWLTISASTKFGVDQLDNVVLINRDAALAGTVPVARLLLADTEDRMSDLTSEPLLSVAPDAKDKDVFELFDKYNLRSLTVVNEQKHPIGAITVDDVVSRMRGSSKKRAQKRFVENTSDEHLDHIHGRSRSLEKARHEL